MVAHEADLNIWQVYPLTGNVLSAWQGRCVGKFDSWDRRRKKLSVLAGDILVFLWQSLDLSRTTDSRSPGIVSGQEGFARRRLITGEFTIRTHLLETELLRRCQVTSDRRSFVLLSPLAYVDWHSVDASLVQLRAGRRSG